VHRGNEGRVTAYGIASARRVGAIFSVVLVVVIVVFTDDFNYPNRTAVVGDSVTISCHSNNSLPVNWWYRTSQQDAEDAELCVNGRLVNGNHRWYNVNDTDHSLTIKSVTLNNAGLYTCGENMGFGDRHATWLIVLGEQ